MAYFFKGGSLYVCVSTEIKNDVKGPGGQRKKSLQFTGLKTFWFDTISISCKPIAVLSLDHGPRHNFIYY